MAEAAELAEQFVAGRERADLDTDRMLLFAVVRAVEVVGEAASRVSGAASRWRSAAEGTMRAALR